MANGRLKKNVYSEPKANIVMLKANAKFNVHNLYVRLRDEERKTAMHF